MYKVIKLFTDLQDNNHLYNVGDKFPRDGMDVSLDRLEALSTVNNLQHTPLIEFVEDEVEPDEVEPEEEQKPKKGSKKEKKED